MRGNHYPSNGSGEKNLLQASSALFPKWTEMVGIFEGLGVVSGSTIIKINEESFAFFNESSEASCLRERLGSNLMGKRIGILRTDLSDKPFLVRLIE